MGTKRILLVEDHSDFAAHVWQYLEMQGWLLDHAVNGAQALHILAKERFDAVVLDLGLPLVDGMEVLQRLRSSGNETPILALTARDQLADKLQGLAAGLDDYLIKPVALAELKARLEAIMRRAKGNIPAWRFADLSLDVETMVARRADRVIMLTPTLGRILAQLMQSAPALLSHQRLIDAVWGDEGTDVRTLHAHLSTLRSLIDRPFPVALIRSEPGQGYRLAEADA